MLRRLLKRVSSLNGLLAATAAALSATVFPAALIPEQVAYLGVLGGVIGIACFLVIAAFTPLAKQKRKRATRGLSIALMITASLIIIIRTNFVHELRDCICLTGWSVSSHGHRMIEKVVEATQRSTEPSALELFESGELALIDIPRVYGTSYQFLKNCYVWTYMIFFLALTALLAILEVEDMQLGRSRKKGLV